MYENTGYFIPNMYGITCDFVHFLLTYPSKIATIQQKRKGRWFMKREIFKVLSKWKESSSRQPLLVRGARQVGKSYAITTFGKENFDSLVEVNFEIEDRAKDVFESLEPESILQSLEIITHKHITPGKTLLFLDEIQYCPRAIMALRYFKEKMPELHVIAAGSLLEFILNDQDFSFPVGRVQFLYMRPLSFLEFLEARGLNILKNHIEKIDLSSVPNSAVHHEFLEQMRLYLTLGGMPAILSKFIENSSLTECRQLGSSILANYENDFGKYARHSQHTYLRRLFEKSPSFVGSHVRYSKIDPEAQNPARAYKNALHLLSRAGLISPIYAVHANGVPLRAEMNEKKFKLLFLDVGLLQCAMGVDLAVFLNQKEPIVNKGQIAEQLVGQELLAYSDPHLDAKLYFWEREQKGSSAQVDYVLQVGSKVIPIEVKSGALGRLKSLRIFMEEKECPVGVKISEEPLGFSHGVLSVPFYLISQLPRLVTSVFKS